MELFGDKVRNEFLQEASVLLKETTNLLPILNNKNSLLIIYRNIQNLNGSCICAGFEDLGILGNALEELVYEIKIGVIEINDDINAAIAKVCENYKQYIGELEIDDSKNIDIESDLNLIQSFSKQDSPPKTKGNEEETEDFARWSPNNKKVFFIDDDPELGKTVSKVLNKVGFDVKFEDTPSQVNFDELKLDADPSYDLVITDLHMPGVNGLEVIKKVREVNASVPIMVISAFGEKDDLIELINLNVDCFIKKPYDAERLVGQVKKLIHQSLLFPGITEISETNVRLNMAFERILFTIADIAEDLKVKDEIVQVEAGIKKIKRITQGLVQSQKELL